MTRALALSLCFLGGLVACAPRGEGSSEGRALAAAGAVQRVFAGLGGPARVSAPRAVPGGFAPEAIAAEPGAYRLVQVNALGLLEPARVIQDNGGGDITLALQSGPTAAFEGGILVATRGFPEDLMTLDAAGLPQVLRAGGGQVARRMEILDDQDQIRIESFACTVTPGGSEEVDLGLRKVAARRLDERCEGRAIIFENIYWLDGAGAIVSSRQFVSPSVAYLRASRL